MDFKSYFLESQLVQVSIAKLENQKITKSMFSQMQRGFKIDLRFYFEGIKIVGYVNMDKGWVIYTENSMLFKADLTPIYDLVFMPSSNYTVENIYNYIDIEDIEIYNFRYDTIHKLPANEQQNFRNLVDKSVRFYNILKSHQIFL